MTGDLTISNATPTLQFTDTDNNYDAKIQGLSGSLVLTADSGGEIGTETIQFNTGAIEALRLDAKQTATFAGTVTTPYVRVTGSGVASLSSTTHGIWRTSGQNLLDNNEVLSRNNGASSTLHLQADGGTVTVGVGTAANLVVVAIFKVLLFRTTATPDIS